MTLSILQVLPIDIAHVSGVRRHVLELSENLKKLGNDVTMVALCSNSAIKGSNQKSMRQIIYSAPKCQGIINNSAFWLHAGQALKRLSDWDIVHIHGAQASILKMNLKKPMIATNHGLEPIFTRYSQSLPQFLLHKLVGLTAYNIFPEKIIAVTTKVQKELEDFYKVPETKIKLIPDGVNTENFRPLPQKELVDFQQKINLDEDRVLLFVGHPTRLKNLHGLLLALARVVKEHSDVKLLVVGDLTHGENGGTIKKIIEKHGLRKHVVFTGFLDGNDLVCAYNCSEALVLPSFYEGCGLAYLEAMSCGLPVIGSTEIADEIVLEGLTGFRVNPFCYECLADRIMLLLQDSKLRKEMGKKARTYAVNNFSWKIITNRILETYDEVLGP